MSDFPVDWNEWQTEWRRFRQENRPRLNHASARFPQKNMLADDVLGTYKVHGVPSAVVELSEVTMPDFGARPERRLRYVGITWLVAGECINGGLVDSFDELAQLLAAGPPKE